MTLLITNILNKWKRMLERNKKQGRILVLAIRAIGDVVLITPVIRRLKQTFPASFLVVLADGVSAQVLESNPHIDRIIVIDRAHSRGLPWFRRISEWVHLVSALRREQFDIVIDLFSGPRSALLGWMSGASERYGEACRQRIRGFLYNRPIVVCRDGLHLVEQKLELIQPLVGNVDPGERSLEVFLTQEEVKKGEFLLSPDGNRNSRIIGLVPNAGSQWRVWPVERFAELADRLVKMYGAHIVLLGGEQDRALCRRIVELMSNKPFNLSGKTSLRDMLAVLMHVDLVIANVTGPMHLAVALSHPKVIGLYGAADTVQYAPWGRHGVLLTKGSPRDAYWNNVDYQHDYDILCQITVDDVLQTVKSEMTDWQVCH